MSLLEWGFVQFQLVPTEGGGGVKRMEGLPLIGGGGNVRFYGIWHLSRIDWPNN